MYLISELLRPDSVNLSRYCKFSELPSALVEVKSDRIEIYDVSLEENNKLKYTAYFKSKVTAISLISIGSDNALVTLDSSNIVSIVYRDGRDKLIVHEVDQLDVKGHQLTIESVPIIVSSVDFFILYHVQGYLQLFTLNENITLTSFTGNTKKRKFQNDKLWTIQSKRLGGITVLKMAILNDNTLAVLYRDFDFNYSMRYYRVSEDFTLVKQFEEFDTPPSCIIPVNQGGVLVLTTSHVFYFPAIGVSVEVDCDVNILGNTVTKPTQILNEDFKAYTVIDNSRILVVTNVGNTYLINLQLKVTNRHVVVNAFNFIKLGKSSIPILDGLFHITDNFFYIVSKWSKSVLFQILPLSPFIHIALFKENTTPIVDLQYTRNSGGNIQLITCQGGYESGELVKSQYGDYKLKWKQTMKLTGMGSSLSVVKNSTYLYTDTKEIFKNGVELSKTEDIEFDEATVLEAEMLTSELIVLSDFGIKFNETFVLGDIILDGTIIDSHVFTIDEANYVKAFTKRKEVASHLITKKYSSFKVIQFSDGYLIFISWVDATLTVLHYFELRFKEVFNHTLLGNCDIFSSIITINDSGLNFIYLNFDGNLVQLKFKYEKSLHLEGSAVLCTSKVPLKLTQGVVILCHTQDEIYILAQDILYDYYRLCFISAEFKGLTDIVSIGGDVAILVQDQISVFSLLSEGSQLHCGKLHAPVLYTKCLKIGRHSIVITQENKLNDSGVNTKSSNLELIDTSKMRTLNTFVPAQLLDIIDICAFNHKKLKGVLALARDTNDSNWLYLFSVKNNKIKLEHQFDIQIDCVLQSIKCFDENELHFSLCGNIVMMVQYVIDNGINVMKNVGTDVKIPILGTSHLFVEQKCFIADITGVIECEVQDKNDRLFIAKKSSDLGQQFLTTMDAGAIGGDTTMVVGDAHGNVLVKSEHSCKFNIGWDQVNCVKVVENEFPTAGKLTEVALLGTLNGGLYKISRLDDEAIIGILEECNEELSSYSVQFNSEALAYKQRKIGGHGFLEEPAEGVIDLRLIRKFVVAKMHKFEKSKTYITCNRNLQLLESLCFEGGNL